jgi:hypothetical protein
MVTASISLRDAGRAFGATRALLLAGRLTARAGQPGLARYQPCTLLVALCARSLKMRITASLTVRMCGSEEGPVGVSRRGPGVRGGVVVVSLP